MRSDLFNASERMYVPIEQIAIPSDISIFGTHFGERTYYADYAGISRKYAPIRVLEIGVRYGYSGIAVCLGAMAAGVEMIRYVGLDAEFFSGPQSDDVYRNYRSNAIAAENFRRFVPAINSEFHTCDTRQGLPRFGPRLKFNLINVDGDHSYEGCYGDLCRVWPRAAPGAIIIVDDTGMEGVKRAIEQFRDERVQAGDLAGFQLYSNERGWAIFMKSNA